MEKIPVEKLASEVMEGLKEYADLATDDLKKSVKKVSLQVKKQISASAPRRTGTYAKSWSTKAIKENSNELIVSVYSRNRYFLAHLLENGHAKRGGGRVSGKPHIAPAEQNGIRQLEQEIKRSLGG